MWTEEENEGDGTWKVAVQLGVLQAIASCITKGSTLKKLEVVIREWMIETEIMVGYSHWSWVLWKRIGDKIIGEEVKKK